MIYVTGMQQEKKIEFKNLLKTLGVDVSFNLEKLDILICEKIQKNMSSRGFDKGILSGDYELGVKHFQDFIKKSLI